MKKSNLVALIVYFACVAYIIGTGIPEAMFGKTSVTDVAGAVMVVFFAALLPAGLVLFLKAIKSASRDPSSFDPESVFVNENATVICVEYRGKNGFGGYSREFAVYSNGKASQSADVWNKQCRKEMYDVTYARQAL